MMIFSSQKGVSFIDVIVGTALVLIVFLGIFGAYQLGIKVIGQSKARIAATALANQKIEMARNLSYDDVGTIGGIPAGTIIETENITRNNIDYTVKTTVIYIDDPFDGLAPTDTLASDYKRVKVRVSWLGRFGGEVNLVTDVMPKGVESEAGGGTLHISVFDASGLDIAQADLHVVNTAVLPVIDAWYQTDNYGDLVLVGAPASVESYQITAVKASYSTDRTYGVAEIANPLKPHTSVYENQLTEISFSIDKLSSFSVSTLAPIGEELIPIPNVDFNLQGAKIIGTTADEEPVYKYSQNHNSSIQGNINIPNLEWDSYTFSLLPGAALDLANTDPAPQPIDLLPDTSLNTELHLEAENSLLLTVRDAQTLLPIFAASCRVYNTSLEYNEQRPTYENGQALFIPLAGATYNLEIAAAGYENYTSTIWVSGDTASTINLNTSP